jgi:hypothetical protein
VSDEVFAVPCRPQTMRQVLECTTSGTPDSPHWMHRKLTGLAHYSCNCGYSSGWVPVGTLPLASDFIDAHMPDQAFLEREETLRRMELGCACHE